MSYIGTVENGQIKLPPDAKLPEGAKVEVELLSEVPLEKFTREVLKVAKSGGKPKDFATNFGHYLFGEGKAVKVFADTSYMLALVDLNDEAHVKALAARKLGFSEIILTDAVILELGAALSKPVDRGIFLALIAAIKAETAFCVKPITEDIMRKALELFSSRPDKAWSLTDCTSFVIMKEAGITDSLTTDRHFTQAGFRALLLPD